jgi:hypothetical protein
LTSTYIGYGSAGNTLTGTANATLNSSGNAYFSGTVGIRTVSQAAPLNVSNNEIVNGIVARFGDADSARWDFVNSGMPTEKVRLDAYNTPGVNTIRLDPDQQNSWINAGNFGIGTTDPQALLDLNNGSQIIAKRNDVGIVAGNSWGTTFIEQHSTSGWNQKYDRTIAGIKVLTVAQNTYGIGGILTFSTGGDTGAATSNYQEQMRIDNNGYVSIGTVVPANFMLQVAGNVGPNASNTYDLGSAANYWATIHYHTLTSHSLSVFSTTVTLQNGKDVSCLDALYEIKADPTKKVKGVPHMDYATIPSVAFNSASTTFDLSSYTVKKNGEDGADLDMMVSLILCANKELDAKIVTLDNRMSNLEQRLSNLEQRGP